MFESRSHNQLMAGVVMVIDVALFCITYVAVLYCYGDGAVAVWDMSYAKSSLAILGIIYTTLAFHGGVVLTQRNAHRWQVPFLVFKNIVFTAVACGVLFYICHIDAMSWQWQLLFYVIAFIVCTTFRMIMYIMVKRYRLKPGHYDEVVLVGSGNNISLLHHEMLSNPQWGYRVVGYFAGQQSEQLEVEGCEYLGQMKDIAAYLNSRKDVNAVFCSLDNNTRPIFEPLIRYCVNNMVTFYSIPTMGDTIHNRLFFTTVGTVPVLTIYDSPLVNPWRQLEKRLFDIIFSLLFLCTLFIPVLIIVTIVTKITMPGPVFFRQKRSGLNGRTFYCLKFRSMKVNNQSDSVQATKGDPRITKWGNFMRHTNIDELPQFINVLLGDMSVVGPRPHMEKQTVMYSKLIEKYMMRHLVKPGVTGWAQVTGFRGETSELWQMEERVKHDIWYIENWSFGLDMFIIYKTIANTVRGDKNAY